MADDHAIVMNKIHAKYMEHFFKFQYNFEEAEKLVQFCYELSGMKSPLIFECDSPMGAILMANYCEKYYSDDKFPPKSTLRRLYNQLMGVFYHKNAKKTKKIEDLRLEHKVFCWRMDSSELGWIIDYDTTHEIDPSKERNEKFEKYKDLILKSGIFMCITYDTICFLVRPPKFLHVDKDNNLHSIEEASIEFRDGYKQYYVHRVNFLEDDWKKFFPLKPVTEKLSQQILGWTNVEQRVAIIKAYGFENLLQYMPNNKKIDTTMMKSSATGEEREASLYEFDFEGEKRKVVSLPDYSTDKVYYILVPSNMKTVDEATAWHLQLSVEDYRKIKLRS